MRALGSETFTFEPEMPLDIVLALDELDVVSVAEVRTWTVAHLLVDTPCDTSCADEGKPHADRKCPAEKALRARLRKVRVNGRRVARDEFHDFYDSVLAEYAVTEGESDSSADSSAAAGDASNETQPVPALTVQGTGVAVPAEPAASGD